MVAANMVPKYGSTTPNTRSSLRFLSLSVRSPFPPCQADSTLPIAERRNYKNVFSALYRISSEEGVLALWKGGGPTVVRAMALNMGMLASYDQTVEFFRDQMGWKEIPTVVGASAVSGFFASACSLPFDYVKTQIQKQKPGPDGKLPYSGSMDCAMKTLKEGGPLKFYSGFATYCIRIAPHVMVSLQSHFIHCKFNQCPLPVLHLLQADGVMSNTTRVTQLQCSCFVHVLLAAYLDLPQPDSEV